MANDKEIIGTVSQEYQPETPWQRIGTRLSCNTLEDALREGDLNWSVSSDQLMTMSDRRPVDRFAIIRESHDRPILGTVGREYQILQNREQFEVLEEACRDHGVIIVGAGQLQRGAKVWLQASLPSSSFEVSPGDNVDAFFTLMSSHDGSTSVQAKLTMIRIICQNTAMAAFADNQSSIYSFRHTSSIKDRIKQANEMLELLFASLAFTGETFKQFYDRKLTKTEVTDFIAAIFPESSKGLTQTIADRRTTVEHLVYNGKGSSLALRDGEPTLWAAFNGVTEYVDHVRPGEAQKDSAKVSANESALFGFNAQIKDLAMRTAQRMLVAA